jgi:uncharacterized protein YkwD
MRRIALFLTVLSAMGIVAASSSGSTTSSATTERLPAVEAGILHRLNVVRAANGMRPLAVSGALQDAAVSHSRAMLQGGFFEHESPDGTSFGTRLRKFYSPKGFDSWSVGENLLFASSVTTPSEVIEAWMQSPEHRDNMLTARWREVGIAALQATSAPGAFGDEPTFLVTMDFGVRGRRSAAAVSIIAKG